MHATPAQQLTPCHVVLCLFVCVCVHVYGRMGALLLVWVAPKTGTAGRLLSDDERKLLPLNVDKGTGEPKYKMKNPAERLPQTQLR